ncbi:hypothetical protein RLOatenuis_6940 [Rickettsiales bacterium]|nr:hypothetical protein RLOatenuis_6940 [Rickettsiales bacterium]
MTTDLLSYFHANMPSNYHVHENYGTPYDGHVLLLIDNIDECYGPSQPPYSIELNYYGIFHDQFNDSIIIDVHYEYI